MEDTFGMFHREGFLVFLSFFFFNFKKIPSRNHVTSNVHTVGRSRVLAPPRPRTPPPWKPEVWEGGIFSPPPLLTTACGPSRSSMG